MLDKSKGLIWYHIFSGILILRALSSLHGFVAPSISASEAGITVSELFSLFPLTNILTVLNALAALIVHVKLFVELRRRSPACIRTTRFLIFYFLVLALLSAAAGYLDYAHYVGSNDLDSYYASCAGMLSGNMVLLVPTYFYLKKRFAAPADPVPASVQFDPFDLVPARLSGVTDQAERDRIIAEIMRGNPNPYTGLPIAGERDWKAYLQDEQTAQRLVHHAAIEPVSPSPDLSGPSSENGPSNASISVPVSESLPQDPPAYCRFCGAALRSDSLFCERCGKSVE